MSSSNRALIQFILAASVLLALLYFGFHAIQESVPLNLLAKRHPPNSEFWFGTDHLGRDLWTQCLQGMMTSIQIGLISAVFSGFLALFFAIISQFNKAVDGLIRTLIDTFIALPHLLLLILICFTFGGGKWGVIFAVSLTHWPKLTLLLRSELLRIRQSDFILLAKRTGLAYWQCCYKHYLPLLLPQLIMGALLIFPHAVLHSAGLSFLGFGLAPHEPSLGLLLSDALRYLTSGDWWLVVYPGLTLVILVLTIDQIARNLPKIWFRRSTCYN